MANKKTNSGAKGKLWVQILCGALALTMVLGVLVLLFNILLA